MSDCKHQCPKTPVVPRQIFNRPGLEAIDYRIGTYSRLRAHMLDQLNGDITLAAWTHRGADDPGIALLEGAAIVGDLLSFYQNLYANEVYLRTAHWHDSVSELVQLSGYRLAPGVGGEAVFAVQVKGDAAVALPKGFGFKAKLAGREQDDEFESRAGITAYPALGRFSLYAPPKPPQAISKDATQLELQAVADNRALSARQAVDIKAGDRIMLVPDSSMWDDTGTDFSEQAPAEVQTVASVEVIADRVVIHFEGALRHNRGSRVRAFKIGRSFSHFGYNAPDRITFFDGVRTRVEATNFERNIYGSFSTIATTPTANTMAPPPPSVTLYSGMQNTDMPLDREVDDLTVGGLLICEGVTDFRDGTAPGTPQRNNRNFAVVKTIEAVATDTVIWGGQEAAVSVVKTDAKLMRNHGIRYETTMDIRRSRFHEVIGDELTLGSAAAFDPGAFTTGELTFFGSYRQVQGLAQRELLLVDLDSRARQSLATTSTLEDFAAQLAERDTADLWMWTVTLDQLPVFPREAFSQVAPSTEVYGNLVHCDQGKTQAPVVLGSGDNRSIFQTFALPKKPLTFLLDESRTPAQVPQLSVYVGDILWQPVDSFFDQPADATVYVVRQDAEGGSYVQFGDGVQGARLPSGRDNITAVYRTGIAAVGNLETDQQPAATGKLPALEKTFLPGEVVGGGEAETKDNARRAAPQKMQSLGRLVGLADFEAEALAIPGVLKVSADWAAPRGVPLIAMTVLTEAASPAALDKVQQTMNSYNRCRGPARHPVSLRRGFLQYLFLSLRVGYEPNCREADITLAVKLALGVVGEEGEGIATETGLFSRQLRRFGQDAHRSHILAAVQQVEGVTWVAIDDAQRLRLGDPPQTDPAQLNRPRVPSTLPAVGCAPDGLLALHSLHLNLSLAMDITQRECEA